LVGELGHQGETRALFHQRQQAVAFTGGTHHGITFPMTDFHSCFHGFGAGIHHGLTLQATTLFRPKGAFDIHKGSVSDGIVWNV